MAKPRILITPMARVSSLHAAKAGRGGRTRGEVDQIITWRAGGTSDRLHDVLEAGVDLEALLLDRLVDELARGRAMERTLRG
jgi:hypothetical protein